MERKLAELRKEYMRQGLKETLVDVDPLKQFRSWFDEALGAGLVEPNAMTLATASQDAKPSARTVLLKGFDEEGFVFYTNYQSRKGRDLEENPWAALLFLWVELERQVRIEGHVVKLRPEESDLYFQSRPAGSQLSTWASAQSQIIAGRMLLEEHMQQLLAQYQGKEIPRPPYWGGYRVIPQTIEFWQGRPNRLHDRLQYRRMDEVRWALERLAP